MIGKPAGTSSLTIGVLALCAMICFFPGTSRGDGVTVTVGGTEYDISTVTGSFSDNMSLLESTPWWGNPCLAEAFAAAVGDELGTPNEFNYGAGGPLFAYDDDAVDAFLILDTTPTPVSVDTITILAFSFGAEVTPTGSTPPPPGSTVPEPGSLTLLFAGLLGFGLFAGMRRLRRNALAT